MNRRLHSLLAAHWLAAFCTLATFVGTAEAQDTFIPPEQYPADRYESGWKKNPFTLKTAPVVEQKKSFAQDLVLYNVYRVDGVTAVIANKKTRETFRLKESQPGPNGMKIRSFVIQDHRKDTYVEVELNGESAVLRHDDEFRKQMVASNSARGNRGPGEPGARERQRMEQQGGGAAPGAGAPPNPGEAPTGKPAPKGPATPPGTVIRPPLPQRPAPSSTTPELAASNAEPANIRPGPGPASPRMLPLPRGAPSRSTRRLLTAPPSAPPPAPDSAPAIP